MVLYFSATGNSEYVAKRIARNIDDELLDLFERIRENDTSVVHSTRSYIIVAPTYAWQLPHIVRDWMRNTNMEGSDSFYFVLTCGDGIGNAGAYAKKLCDEKGVRYMGCAEILMPENYIAMFPVPDASESRMIVECANPVIDSVSDSIAAGENLSHRPGLVSKILSSFVNSFFYRFVIGDKKFHVSESCTKCRKCVDGCPVRNIELVERLPKWNGKCIHCMKCICSCPVHAIEYGKKSVGKPRYRCPDHVQGEHR